MKWVLIFALLASAGCGQSENAAPTCAVPSETYPCLTKAELHEMWQDEHVASYPTPSPQPSPFIYSMTVNRPDVICFAHLAPGKVNAIAVYCYTKDTP